MIEHVSESEPPRGNEIPPVPPLTGDRATIGARKLENGGSLILNTIMLIIGAVFLYLILRFVITTAVKPREVLQFPRNLLTTFVLLSLSGTYMVARSLQGFMKLFKQRKDPPDVR